jgi:hypothetical protein
MPALWWTPTMMETVDDPDAAWRALTEPEEVVGRGATAPWRRGTLSLVISGLALRCSPENPLWTQEVAPNESRRPSSPGGRAAGRARRSESKPLKVCQADEPGRGASWAPASPTWSRVGITRRARPSTRTADPGLEKSTSFRSAFA